MRYFPIWIAVFLPIFMASLYRPPIVVMPSSQPRREWDDPKYVGPPMQSYTKHELEKLLPISAGQIVHCEDCDEAAIWIADMDKNRFFPLVCTNCSGPFACPPDCK